MENMYHITGGKTAGLEEVGGKGLSLMRMAGAGLPVPPGFILPVGFFAAWLERVKESAAWRDFLAASPEEYSSRCAALKELCPALEFDPRQLAILEEGFSTLDPAYRNGLFAVRSSSPEEDVEGASFAGGYQTVLGVDRAGIPDAVRICFASCLDERVFHYKRSHGFSTREARIAVVVQAQIPSDVSGVGFSLNPLNNCYDEALVNANWGLGESVVSGMTSPDQFVVGKLTRRIIDSKVGAKESSVWLKAGGGTEIRHGHRCGEACLDERQLLEVVDTIRKVEDFYGNPVDTEWAFHNGRLHLLQARPVTAYVPLPEDLLTKPGERKRLYLDMTLCVQGIHESMSVMGVDMVERILGGISMSGLGVDARGLVFCRPKGRPAAGGRVYVNISNYLTVFSKERIASVLRNMDSVAAETILAIDADEYRAATKPVEFEEIPLKALTHMPDNILRALEAAVLPSILKREYHHKIDDFLSRLEAADARDTSATEFLDALCGMFAEFIAHCSLPIVVLPIVAKGKIIELFKDAPPDVRRQIESLNKSLSGNVTVDMGLALFRLSELLGDENPGSTDEFKRRLEARALPAEFLSGWDEFIATYGFRGPVELDIASPRYVDKPELLLGQILAVMPAKGTEMSPVAVFKRSRAERQAAYEALSKKAKDKGWMTSKLFEHLYGIIENFGAYRENHKYYLIMAFGRMRKKVLCAAAVLVSEGRIDSPSDLFNLTVDDLRAVATTPGLDLRALIAERRRYVDKLAKVKELPHLIDSRGRIPRPPRKAHKEGEIVGEGVSSGVARGPVKVLSRPDEKPLLPGDILVAKATDPGWTTLSINAAAIVLEVGGALQHGSLVAREYGKPCVAGVENLTSLLRDGQMVEVDGAEGVVRLL